LARPRSIKAEKGFRPAKRLGQHFLIDPEVIQRIITRARLQSSEWVLEIGPGQGALTLPLARSVAHVVAVEKDTRLINKLKGRLDHHGIKNVTLINDDILLWNFREVDLTPPAKLRTIGNLPYNISAPVLDKLVRNRDVIDKAILMFQREVAQRLTASPGGKAYGVLTLSVQYHAQSRVLFEVSKNAFHPKPKVDSMVVELDFERPHPKAARDEDNFRRILKGAFAHRRKTIVNSFRSLPGDWDKKVLLKAMERCGIDPRRRAETLHMDEFLCLSDILSLTKHK
jgi:16S rRNA (adenine1518-N6/adenine1519-N6)-dimethyltransferase